MSTRNELLVVIDERTGEISMVRDDELTPALSQACGRESFQRASHVEPIDLLMRAFFHVLRWRAADMSWRATISRQLPGPWQARIFGGPTLGPFVKRQDAIDAEISWLEERL